MIRFYQHNDIDIAKWNKCVEHASSPTIFANYELLSLVSPGWCALIRDDYDAVMPLPSRSKWGLSYVFTPFFISRLGIFSRVAPDATETASFIKAIPGKYKQCDLCLNSDNDISLLSENAYRMMVSYSLELNLSYETLFANFSGNTRRNIKTAHKFSLSLTSADILQLVDLFRQNRGKDRSVCFKDADYRTLVSMVQFWQQRDLVELLGVKDENGRFIAGACFLKDYQRRWFLFSGRDTSEGNKRAMFYLLSEYVKKCAGEELVLDFNGSMNPNVARFYAGFGSQKYEFPMLTYTPPSVFAPFIKWYRQKRL